MAVREGALDDPGFNEFLHHKAHVFEDGEPFSLSDMIGKIIPTKAGWVGSCYRLSDEYPNRDFFYARSPTGSLDPIRPLYDHVSTTTGRKAEKAVSGEKKGERGKSGGFIPPPPFFTFL